MLIDPACTRVGRFCARSGVFLLAWLVSLSASATRAIDLESLVMPGPVIEGHADVESQCAKCHRPFAGISQRDLCLDCHEKIAADIHEGLGFHGHAPGPRSASCRSCHTEHTGRKADVTGLDPEAFDHELTDYPLEGSHRQVRCVACHEEGKKHRDAPTRCYDCHRDDDTHKGNLGEGCGDCHSENSWRDAKFDHSKTEFPLADKHAGVECGLCHPNEQYKKSPKDCYSCHRLNDEHRGSFGKKCEACHSPAGWKRSRFDHDRDTEWPLAGRHQKVACTSCHKGSLHGDPTPKDCFSCHRSDDDHRGKNGRGCEDCHSPTGWKTLHFDHDRDTDYKIRGAHKQVQCSECHKGILHKEKMKTNCVSCHSKDDVHRKQQGSTCERCHNETGWSDDVFFDHELTEFPLLALHAVVSCEDCHQSGAFKDASVLCNDCHAAEDVHKRRLGRDCARCHTPNGWPIWQFDHDQDTDYPLRDAHRDLDCHACHRRAVHGKVSLSHTCYACHAQDDAHRNAFGRRCEKCHTETKWRDAELNP